MPHLNNRLIYSKPGQSLVAQWEDYYIECLSKLRRGEPTLRVDVVDSYAEAKTNFATHMDERIRIQLKHNNVKDSNVVMIPKLYCLNNLSDENAEDFTSLSNDDKPITKWLDKRGWIFATGVLRTPVCNVIMMFAALMPKILLQTS